MIRLPRLRHAVNAIGLRLSSTSSPPSSSSLVALASPSLSPSLSPLSSPSSPSSQRPINPSSPPSSQPRTPNTVSAMAFSSRSLAATCVAFSATSCHHVFCSAAFVNQILPPVPLICLDCAHCTYIVATCYFAPLIVSLLMENVDCHEFSA